VTQEAKMMKVKHQVIKNVVFDIGNVLVQWNPQVVIALVFPEVINPTGLSNAIFKSPIWYDLNLGKLSEKAAIALYASKLGIAVSRLEKLMFTIKESLIPVAGSFELLDKLSKAGIPLYCITNNVQETMTYLKKKYDFWYKFIGIVVSAEVSVLKPSPEIYQHLLKKYHLIPGECVFFDDILSNVNGAKAVGMHAVKFTTALQCKKDLWDKFGIAC
jgi:putative hydrolase of the HAD superfamily